MLPCGVDSLAVLHTIIMCDALSMFPASCHQGRIYKRAGNFSVNELFLYRSLNFPSRRHRCSLSIQFLIHRHEIRNLCLYRYLRSSRRPRTRRVCYHPACPRSFDHPPSDPYVSVPGVSTIATPSGSASIPGSGTLSSSAPSESETTEPEEPGSAFAITTGFTGPIIAVVGGLFAALL
ncbi:hypothetical protein BKA70DRAFT_532362 [Coprinopsis sp. MPI-PUGE-AT-0042]|nr:hypothetical protein BKA70DRAFT_532362 [Coprinopsis sp. MPI-PUGE-AT-0042]